MLISHIGFVFVAIFFVRKLTSVHQSHVAATLAIALVALSYWYTWAKLLPRLGGYRLDREVVNQEDGTSRTVLKMVTVC